MKSCSACKSMAYARIVETGWGGPDCCPGGKCEHRNERYMQYGACWKCEWCGYTLCNAPVKVDNEETLPCYVKHMLERHPEVTQA